MHRLMMQIVMLVPALIRVEFLTTQIRCTDEMSDESGEWCS
ncbi:hypothetical protein FHT29_006027 [Rhizobium sp. SG741]|nr:hypothetical protein [Rhizobium sp. SG741]